MEACQTYELTYTNNLEGPNPGGEWNNMKDPNTTNIHTHGLHISGESPADDVLFVELTPGDSHTCEWGIRDFDGCIILYTGFHVICRVIVVVVVTSADRLDHMYI